MIYRNISSIKSPAVIFPLLPDFNHNSVGNMPKISKPPTPPAYPIAFKKKWGKASEMISGGRNTAVLFKILLSILKFEINISLKKPCRPIDTLTKEVIIAQNANIIPMKVKKFDFKALDSGTVAG